MAETISSRRPPSPRNILVIQLGDIGDVVLATPTFRALKECRPDARISVLVRRPYGSLLSADPVLHEVIEAGKGRGKRAELGAENLRLVRRLRGAGYDLVIDLRIGDRGAIIAWLTGAPVRVVRHDLEAPFWHDRLAFTHPVEPVAADRPVHPGGDQSLRIVRAIGIDTIDSAPRLHVAPDADLRVRELLAEIGLGITGRWITVNPFSRWRYKEWAYGKWGEVIDRIWESHRLPALVIGSREEAGAAGEIVRDRRDRAWSLAGRTTLGQLAALLRGSTLHLGVDSAAPHIAAAVGAPTVTIFGPSDWKAWTVVDDLHRVVVPDMECVPCHRMGCDGKEKSVCLERLGSERVVRTAQDILAASAQAGHIPEGAKQ